MTGKRRVTVNDGWAVYVHGEQVNGGQTVDLDTDTAEYWIDRGWATAADPPAKPKRRRTPRNS